MGKARFDTYELETITYGTYKEARDRKEALVKDGWRVKIRKDTSGAYTVLKKHDELFHDLSWRDING